MPTTFHTARRWSAWLLALCAGAALAAGPRQGLKLVPQSMQLPAGTGVFPGEGSGAKAANTYCVMCHSADMVTNQPALSDQAWLAEVNKMKDTFKAPIPPDQVQAIAAYLAGIKGKP